MAYRLRYNTTTGFGSAYFYEDDAYLFCVSEQYLFRENGVLTFYGDGWRASLDIVNIWGACPVSGTYDETEGTCSITLDNGMIMTGTYEPTVDSGFALSNLRFENPRIDVKSEMVILTDRLHDNSVLRLKELNERIPMNGQLGQVLVWGDNGPEWVSL